MPWSTVRVAVPAANPSGIAMTPTRSTSASVVTTVTPKPASDARTGSTVLCVAYRPRAVMWPSASNGTAIANAVSTDAVTATSCGIELAAAQEDLDGDRGDDREQHRGDRGQDADGQQVGPDEAPERAPVAGRPHPGQ